jgi:hypothetical protein
VTRTRVPVGQLVVSLVLIDTYSHRQVLLSRPYQKDLYIYLEDKATFYSHSRLDSEQERLAPCGKAAVPKATPFRHEFVAVIGYHSPRATPVTGICPGYNLRASTSYIAPLPHRI